MRRRTRDGGLASAWPRCVAAALAPIAVAGCTSMSVRTAGDYDLGSSSEAQFRKDVIACEKQAEAHGKEFGYGPYDPTHGAYNRMFDMCMRSSGYQRKPPS